MVKIQRIKVLKMACFMGLFGVFAGVLFGIIFALLALFFPALVTYAIWMMLILVPIIYGVTMFLSTLIFTPLMNLTLKIIKGLDLDMDLTASDSDEKITPIKTNKKKDVKSTKITKNPELISQMTNSKITAQNPILKTPIKPAI